MSNQPDVNDFISVIIEQRNTALNNLAQSMATVSSLQRQLEEAQNNEPDTETIDAYHILYRNKNTGTWTLTAYNIPNAPPDIICILQGGLSSYILPDIDAINEMLDKQQEGLDEPLKPKTNEKQT